MLPIPSYILVCCSVIEFTPVVNPLLGPLYDSLIPRPPHAMMIRY